MFNRSQPNRFTPFSLIAFCFLLTAQPLSADTAVFQSHESIREAARQHILAQTADLTTQPEIDVDRLDSRLRLEHCSQPLETFAPPGDTRSARVTVGVRCDGDKPWSLYVSARIRIMMPILVAAQDLPRGSLLTRDNLALEQMDIASLYRGYLEEPAAVIGKRLKRDVRRGDVLLPHQIATPVAIRKGNRVTILATSGTVEIRMQGRALSDGATGERILVRNTSSEKEIEATVISPGIVQVTL